MVSGHGPWGRRRRVTPSWPLSVSIVVLAISALVLVTAGVRFTHVVDAIADRTGLGEALAGAVLLGATTSLPGLITTISGAASGEAGFAVSNAVGGIAAQTTFLAIADLSYRRVNLEHAAASVPNLVQTMSLVSLIGIVLAATGSPDVTIASIHPATVLLVTVYGYGLVLSRRANDAPMWSPRTTDDTVDDEPDDDNEQRSMASLWTWFGALAAVVAVTGWAVGAAGLSIARSTSLSGSLVGALFTAVITSLPELVTVLAAVRIGAVTLAVADIVGGNTFDVLFVAAADVVYRQGSVYHAADSQALFLLALTVLLTAQLAGGMLQRERRHIGFEGVSILGFYGLGVVSLVALG
jgi:cation:H+ antiporter